MTSIPPTLTPEEFADLDVSELYDLGLWPPPKQLGVLDSLSGAVSESAPGADLAEVELGSVAAGQRSGDSP